MKKLTTDLLLSYDQIIQEIAKSRGYELDYDKDYYWIGKHGVGGMCDINHGEYFITGENIVLIYEENISKELFDERYEASMNNKFTTNLYHYAVLGRKER